MFYNKRFRKSLVFLILRESSVLFISSYLVRTTVATKWKTKLIVDSIFKILKG